VTSTVTLLCSGVALGVYIPAIKLNYQLRQRGLSSEVAVLETYIVEEKRNKIGTTKREFHHSFKFALKGQKLALATDIRDSLDDRLLAGLLERWNADGRRVFLVFSGFWLPILELYKMRYRLTDVRVEIIHIDADYSPSFQNYPDLCAQSNNVWLFHYESGRVINEIVVTDEAPVPFAERRSSCIIHGGGWGMGTYQSKIPELREHGVLLDILAYYPEEADHGRAGERFFMSDPAWSPWLPNEQGEHTFPPFAELVPGTEPIYRNVPHYHLLIDVARVNKAIISKPGGSTLVDSLATATPIVFLEPFGPHEQKNADLWVKLGFGISYEAWRQTGFSLNHLEGLHTNLQRNRTTFHDLGRNFDATKNRSQV